MSPKRNGKFGELTLIIGPMKSSKTLMMCAHFKTLGHTDIAFQVFSPTKDTRDIEGWESEAGIILESKIVDSLESALDKKYEEIGIDEIHMFDPGQADIIKKILMHPTDVIVSGLDMDYRGVMYEIIRKLLEFGPVRVDYRRAVCHVCKKWNAAFTQIMEGSEPMTGGLPSILVADGTHKYSYVAACLEHFVRK